MLVECHPLKLQFLLLFTTLHILWNITTTAVFIVFILKTNYTYFFLSWRDKPLLGLGLLIHEDFVFLDHTKRPTTVGRTPLDG